MAALVAGALRCARRRVCVCAMRANTILIPFLRETRERYIKAKYELRRFTHRPEISTQKLQEVLISSVTWPSQLTRT